MLWTDVVTRTVKSVTDSGVLRFVSPNLRSTGTYIFNPKED